jgi:GntR family transcriptional regulator
MNTDSWTSVSTPYVSGQGGDPWGAEASAHGGTGSQKLLGVDEVPASATIAHMLGLNANDPVIARRRLMLFDDRPVEITDSYYPASIAQGTRLAEPRKIPGGAVAYLAGLGHRPRHVREDVSARLATEDEQTVLRLGTRSCVLLLARTLYAEQDLPVEASIMTMTADGRQLRYELTP